MKINESKYKHISFERKNNGVVVATLNRPRRLNAINRRLHWEMTQLPLDAAADRDLRVLVITGAGRGFCAGGDFAPPEPGDLPADTTELPEMTLEALQIVENLLDCPKPVISAINGPAMGLGATYALLCDVVIAGRSASIADTHVRIAVGAGDGGQLIWPLLMGPNRAKYFLMTGEKISGEEGERLGLVNFVVDDADVMKRALAIADRLARGPGMAISASKVPLNRYLKSLAQQIMPYSIALEGDCFNSEDCAEAVKAFQEKREPVFRGR